MQFTRRIEGAAELDKILRRLPEEIARKELTGAVRAGATIVRKAVQDRAPVRSDGKVKFAKGGTKPRLPGQLKASIRTGLVKGGQASVTVAVGIGKAFWGRFVELGTRYAPARPFFRPAWDASKIAALNKIGIDLGKRVERAALRLAGQNPTRKRR